MNDERSLPTVTWVMAVKNGMPYLAETLNSIRGQTYENWDVLIWDNGSTDGTLELLREWVPWKLPGRIIVDQPQENLATSLAKCMELCEAELVARIDADDICLPDRLEHQVAFLLGHPEVAVVGGNVVEIDSAGVVQGIRRPFKTDPLQIRLAFIWENPMAQPATLLRRSAVMSVGNYRNVGPVNVEDYDLWMRVASRFQLANLDRVVLKYRVHDRSTTMRSARAKTLDAATENCLSSCANDLYGCTPGEILGIRKGARKPVLPIFRKMAAHFEQSGDLKTDYFSEPAFLAALIQAGGRPVHHRLPLLQSSTIRTLLRSLLRYLRERRSKQLLAAQTRSWSRWQRKYNGLILGRRALIQGLVAPSRQLDLGRDFVLESGALLEFSSDLSSLKAGSGCTVGAGSKIYVGESIILGWGTRIGSDCRISSRSAELRSDLKSGDTHGWCSSVLIGDEVRLGARVTVFPGITIGSRSEVLPGSVVTQSIPENETWGGIPAVRLGPRS